MPKKHFITHITFKDEWASWVMSSQNKPMLLDKKVYVRKDGTRYIRYSNLRMNVTKVRKNVYKFLSWV